MSDPKAKAAAAKIDWSKIPEEKIAGGLSRRVAQTHDFTLVYYTYPPGATFKLHQHPEAQLTYVIRGQIAFDVDGERSSMVPGDWLYIPGGARHTARAGNREAVVAMNIFTPKRQNFPDAQ